MISLDDVRAAHERIRPYIHRTPVFTSRAIDARVGATVVFKCENFQRGGSFKIRGALNAVLSLDAGPGASHLFSTEDQIGRVYRYTGTGAGELAAEFALGPLHFIGEAYIGTEWRMLFSCCVIDYTNEQFRFQIRAISTDQLLAAFE